MWVGGRGAREMWDGWVTFEDVLKPRRHVRQGVMSASISGAETLQ